MDSSLFASADGSPRPAYDVLTHHPVPPSLPARDLLPASEWLSACGATTPALPANPAPTEDPSVTGTVSVPRGSFTPTELMPAATGRVMFYLDRPAPGTLLGASAPLATRDGATATAAYALPTSDIAPGTHRVVAVYADLLHKFTASFPLTLVGPASEVRYGAATVRDQVHEEVRGLAARSLGPW